MAPTAETPGRPPERGIVWTGGTGSTDLSVRGAVPIGMSGRIVGIGPDSTTGEGVVHSVELRPGRVATYRSRPVLTDAVAHRLGTERVPGPPNVGSDVVAHNIVPFGGAILALGDGSLAYELTSDLDTLRRVDVAGQSKGILACAERDVFTGDLHALTAAVPGSQEHIAVSSGALTRRSRPIVGAPARVTHVAIAGGTVVFGGEGFVGITLGDAGARTNWIATGVHAARLLHVHDAGDEVVLLAITPSLERWTWRIGATTIDRKVVDSTPRRFVQVGPHPPDRELRVVWTTGAATIARHDLAAGSHLHCRLTARVPGDLAFVPDAARPDHRDGGWLVVFGHDTSRDSELVVIASGDLSLRPIATVRLPARLPHHMRCAWIPSTRR